MVEQIAEEKREIESRIEKAKNQVTQMELKMRTIPEASQTSNVCESEGGRKGGREGNRRGSRVERIRSAKGVKEWMVG